MTGFFVDYATPSVYRSERDRALLGMTADARRPVRFHGRIAKHTFLLRFALRALGELIWSDDTWDGASFVLDPIITVHPDRVFFEAFSADQSAYGQLIVDRELFETEGELRTGTTNVDFTAWLWAALSELRSSRETWLRIGPEGFEVQTIGAGGRFQRKVDVPDPWVRGFLQLQAAMAMPGTRLSIRPVDLLAAIRFMCFTKAKVSPRALRWVFPPDRDAKLVLEPWEHEVPLRGAEHGYAEERSIRVWGRRRLRLIEPLLPFAERVGVYLKGRALPSFYAVELPGMTFVLGLSGWTRQRWTETASFDLLSPPRKLDAERLARARSWLAERFAGTERELADALAIDRAEAARLLEALVRKGRAVYDVERRGFRHRELFEVPIDEARLYPPDPRREAAEAHVAAGRAVVRESAARETRKVRRLKTPDGPVDREVVYRDWEMKGAVADQPDVQVVLSDSGRVIFGRCGCAFFAEHVLNRGPCEHMAALVAVGEAARQDLPSSTAAAGDAPRPPARRRDEDDEYDESEGDEPLDDGEE